MHLNSNFYNYRLFKYLHTYIEFLPESKLIKLNKQHNIPSHFCSKVYWNYIWTVNYTLSTASGLTYLDSVRNIHLKIELVHVQCVKKNSFKFTFIFY